MIRVRPSSTMYKCHCLLHFESLKCKIYPKSTLSGESRCGCVQLCVPGYSRIDRPRSEGFLVEGRSPHFFSPKVSKQTRQRPAASSGGSREEFHEEKTVAWGSGRESSARSSRLNPKKGERKGTKLGDLVGSLCRGVITHVNLARPSLAIWVDFVGKAYESDLKKASLRSKPKTRSLFA